jgi:hypothetical protein
MQEKFLSKISVDLNGFSHDRSESFKQTGDKLFAFVENFANQDELSSFFDYFNDKYNLPIEVVQQKLKKSIADSYRYQEGSFKGNLKLVSIPKSILKYGSLLFSLLFTKKNQKIKKYELIIDDINSAHELERFEKLLKLFDAKNVLCISKNLNLNEKFPEYNIINQQYIKNYDKSDVFKTLFQEFFHGFWLIFKLSIITRVNLLDVSIEIIHDYLAYKSMFESNKAKYIIQERHYGTNAIKNYLFKSLGGKTTSCIQKNILQLDVMFFYADIDILFSLGNLGTERFFEYGGRIDKVEPSGSLFMEFYWFSKKNKIEKNYDIVALGINTSNAYSRLDSYEKFTNDYLSFFHWLVRIKKENPNYKVALKHHASAGKLTTEGSIDMLEDKILLNSGIEIIDNKENSYKAAFSSRCTITYGSTMGYELNGHNLPSLFVDPNFRCSFLPDQDVDYLKNLRATTFSDFSKSIKEIMSNPMSSFFWKGNKVDLCLESSNVSDRIYHYFIEKKNEFEMF